MPLQLPKCECCGEAEVQWTCPQCDESFCNKCDQNRHNSKKTKEHKRVPYSEAEGISTRCQIKGHEDNKLSLFCGQCSFLICANCIIQEHKNHSPLTDLKSAVENVKSSLLKNQNSIQEEINKTEELNQKIIEEIKKKEQEIKKKEQELQDGKDKVNKLQQTLEDSKKLGSKSIVDPLTFLSLALKLNPTVPVPVPVGTVSPTDPLLDHVAGWIKKPVKEWKLLYKWSQDTQTNEEWHSKCDEKGPTVTVVRTKGGYVFGGYAHIPWLSKTNNYQPSKESFLFSLTDGKGRIPIQCLQYQRSGNAISHNGAAYGPTWGGGYDLYINLSKSGIVSNSNLGYTYKGPGVQGSTENLNFFAGSKDGWIIEEIETYLV